MMTLTKFKKWLDTQLGEVGEEEQMHRQLLLDTYAAYLVASKSAKKHGRVVVTSSGQVKRNPAVDDAREQHKLMLKLLSMFGVKPTARTGSSLLGDDETAKAFGG